ncbi:MAG: hypothetical protein HOI95_16285 [Chromatiales bacterium]|nr:hypothetical protein [Chromatiales bacterium]
MIDRTDDGANQPDGSVDVMDLEHLSAALKGQDAISHLAAIDATPQAFFHTNVVAAWNVLHCGYEADRRWPTLDERTAYNVQAAHAGSSLRANAAYIRRSATVVARVAASDLNLSAEFIGPSILRSLLEVLVREFDTKSNNRE